MNNNTFNTIFSKIENSKSVEDLKLDLIEMIKENEKYPSNNSRNENEIMDSMLFLIAELEERTRRGRNSLSKDQTERFCELIEGLHNK
ncbi:MAG: hypothetical protein ACTS2F_07220 [Thainema sp.]